MTDREKLVSLLGKINSAAYIEIPTESGFSMSKYGEGYIADYLIAHGVTVRQMQKPPHGGRKEGCGMGKMKEDLKDMMKHFNWERFIVGIVAAVAVASFLFGIIMPLATNNGWYLLLGIVPVLCAGFISGVNG